MASRKPKTTKKVKIKVKGGTSNQKKKAAIAYYVKKKAKK